MLGSWQRVVLTRKKVSSMKKRPSRLHFQLQSFVPGPYAGHGLWLREGELYAYYADLGPNELPILETYNGVSPLVRVPEPTEEMWDRFYDALIKIRVKNWKKEYLNHFILDGGGWYFKVRFRDIYRSVSGMNADPDEFINGEGEHIVPMTVLEEAIDDLSSGMFRKVLEDAKW